LLLSEIIIERIKEEGPISFHDYMEMALYYPGKGYYTSDKNKIGTTGDFYTSSSLTHVFGAMIGKQLEQMWEIIGRKEFTIVEYGAGTGMLCHDILDYLKNSKVLYDQLKYIIIEKSPVMRENQKTHLKEKVSWINNIEEIREITGCVLSNELLDNFSVHQVIMEDELMEVFVDYTSEFVEILQPANQLLKNYFAELNITLPKGFRTEINLEATEWINTIAGSISKGYVITIDYGYPSIELYNKRRSRGTLLSYHKHTINENPYIKIGEQDITSHVNFSALCHWGFKSGLVCCGLTNQANFLSALGFKDYLNRSLDPTQDPIIMAKQVSFITRTLLLNMGPKFKVLIQRKGVPADELIGVKMQ
jgi:SAM-dependent MidA family methyltransferase